MSPPEKVGLFVVLSLAACSSYAPPAKYFPRDGSSDIATDRPRDVLPDVTDSYDGADQGTERPTLDAVAEAVTGDTPSDLADGCVTAQEICNGKDDNCNGLIDETFAWALGKPCSQGVGACRRENGSTVCGADGVSVTCSAVAGTPRTELCNGQDDDCDGTVDNGFRLGAPCVVGTGRCQRDGLLVCAQNGEATACSAVASAGKEEVCNGEDDDCNGVIDDLTGPCGSNVGTCKPGTRVCEQGRETCQTSVGPVSETCDGLDNDCDGEIDEDFAWALGKPCLQGIGACKREGRNVCAPDRKSVVCSVMAAQPAAEVCNGLDDNCDGIADYTNIAGKLESACACNPIPVKPVAAEPDTGSQGLCDPVASSLTCEVEPDGDLAMNFCVQACTAPFPWAQCKYSVVSLNSFDADHDGDRLLEVSFCNDTKLFGSLNLYYGEYPRRKWLELLTQQEKEQGLSPNCWRRLFKSSDALCPRYDAASPAPGTFPDACRTNGCMNGRWAATTPECKFDYDQVRAWITSEFCVAGNLGQSVRIQNVRLRLLPPVCTCASESECKDLTKPICDVSVTVSDPRCVNGKSCVGICTSAP